MRTIIIFIIAAFVFVFTDKSIISALALAVASLGMMMDALKKIKKKL